MWPRRKLKAENAQLRVELFQARAELDEARADADQARQVQQFQIGQRAEVEQGARRVQDRNRRLTEVIEGYRDGSLAAQLETENERLQQRLERSLRGCQKYRQRLGQKDTLLTSAQRLLKTEQERRKKAEAEAGHNRPAPAPGEDRGPLVEGGPRDRRQSLVTLLSLERETSRKLEERLAAYEKRPLPPRLNGGATS